MNKECKFECGDIVKFNSKTYSVVGIINSYVVALYSSSCPCVIAPVDLCELIKSSKEITDYDICCNKKLYEQDIKIMFTAINGDDALRMSSYIKESLINTFKYNNNISISTLHPKSAIGTVTKVDNVRSYNRNIFSQIRKFLDNLEIPEFIAENSSESVSEIERMITKTFKHYTGNYKIEFSYSLMQGIDYNIVNKKVFISTESNIICVENSDVLSDSQKQYIIDEVNEKLTSTIKVEFE